MLLKGQLNICKDDDKDSALESVICEKFIVKNCMQRMVKLDQSHIRKNMTENSFKH